MSNRFVAGKPHRFGPLSQLRALTAGLAVCAGLACFSQSATAAPLLLVSTTNEFVPSLPPVVRIYVSAGTNRFALLVPPGFRMNDTTTERVSLVDPDFSCFLSFRIAGPVPSDSTELDTDAYRQRVLMEHPGAIIKQTLSVVAGGRRGVGFDVQWAGAGVSRTERVVYVPTETWVVQFSLLANTTKFAGGIVGFNSLLLTFRASEGGKLEIARLSDKL